jgi:hypothetical protein
MPAQGDDRIEIGPCTDPETGQLLAGYELGALTGEECARVEEHLLACPACLESLYRTAPHAQWLRESPALVRARWAAHAREAAIAAAAALAPGTVVAPGAPALPARRAPVHSLGHRLRGLAEKLDPARHPRAFWLPVGAAAAAVALVAIFSQNQASFGDLAQVEPLRYVQMPLRGALPAHEVSFREGMEAYTAGNYAAAAGRLAQAVRAGEAEPSWGNLTQARLYLGVSLLLTGKAAEAVPDLEQARGSPLRPLADRAGWYLAQAHLLLEDPDSALPVLEGLASGGSAYAEPAARQAAAIRGRTKDHP